MAAANYLRPKKAEREFVNFKKPTNATLALGKSGVCRMCTGALPSPTFGVTIYTQACENNTYNLSVDNLSVLVFVRA